MRKSFLTLPGHHILGLEAVQLSESANTAYQMQLNALEHLASAANKCMVDVMNVMRRNKGKGIVSAFDCNAHSMCIL